jgi:hypothetical protein
MFCVSTLKTKIVAVYITCSSILVLADIQNNVLLTRDKQLLPKQQYGRHKKAISMHSNFLFSSTLQRCLHLNVNLRQNILWVRDSNERTTNLYTYITACESAVSEFHTHVHISALLIVRDAWLC